VPVATGDGDEEIVLTLVIDDDRIGAGTIGDPLVQLLKVVLVVDVDGITVGAAAGGLGTARQWEAERQDGRGKREPGEILRFAQDDKRTPKCVLAVPLPRCPSFPPRSYPQYSSS
jgi:hypothetical protein